MNKIFNYPDTNSARGEFEFLNRKFSDQRIAIIGLGGTGSYILDLIAKTPVKEIHLYDGDTLQLHNAFRSPGALDGAVLDNPTELYKVEYYKEIYSRMHNGIVGHAEFITLNNVHSCSDFSYVFVCVDDNKARKMIVDYLLSVNVPIIDTGLGVNLLDDCLIGTIRTTSGTKNKSNHIDARIGSEDVGKNEYSTNIQIAELNCMNAVLAVIKWKKMSGFFQDLKREHNTLYFINTNKIINEDFEP